MKTARGLPPQAVDFSWNKQLVNQAAAHAQYANLPSQNQTESASAAKSEPKPACRTVNGYPDGNVVAHSTRPLMGTDKYPAGRILRGKWVLHVFLERR